MPNKKVSFDNRGKSIIFRTHFLNSENYRSLSPQSKVLIQLLRMPWNSSKAVDYGVREASEKIPCAFNTAINAFKQLQDRGFIELIGHSFFSSSTGSKSRSWRLTWMPYKDEPPTNDWEKWVNKK